MSEDRRDDPDASPAEGIGPPDAAADPPALDPRRLELAKLRVKVAELRRWCQHFLGEPAAAGVLPPEQVAELLSVGAAVSEPEVMAFYEALGRGQPFPPSHPAFRPGPGEPADPAAALAALTAERERLRVAFFSAYDAVFPDDVPTEAEIRWGMEHPCGQSISEILDEIEQELGPATGGRP